MEKCCLPGCEEFSRESYGRSPGRFCYGCSSALQRIRLPDGFRYSADELEALAKVLALLDAPPLKQRRWVKMNPPCHRRRATPVRGSHLDTSNRSSVP